MRASEHRRLQSGNSCPFRETRSFQCLVASNLKSFLGLKDHTRSRMILSITALMALGLTLTQALVSVPPPISSSSQAWTSAWGPAYLTCRASATTSAAVCNCQFQARKTARLAGQPVPMTAAQAARWGALMGQTVPLLNGSVIFNHSPAQQALFSNFTADMAQFSCGANLQDADCLASGDYSDSGNPAGLGTCTCISGNWQNGIGGTAGASCGLFGATNAAAIALWDNLGNFQFGPDGTTPENVASFGSPQYGAGIIPGSQVRCQNAGSIVAGACPFSPGRAVCEPNVVGQACDSPDPTLPPAGQNAIYQVDAQGLYITCPPDGPAEVFDPTLQACIQQGAPSGWCNNRGYLSQESYTDVPICACNPGYSGSQCQFVIGCTPECTATNQFCNIDASGGPQCECLPGYSPSSAGPCSGYDPNSNVTCIVPCLHGSCATPEVCACADGWTGEDCSVPVCPDNCNNVGKCSLVGNTPTCVCPANMGINPPANCGSTPEWAIAGPCMNGATPNPDGINCNCAALTQRWTGNTCNNLPSCSVCCPVGRCTCQTSASQANCRAPWHYVNSAAWCCNWYHCVSPSALVLGAHGDLVRIGEVKKGDVIFNNIETSQTVAMESVESAEFTKHAISSLVSVCRMPSARHLIKSIETGDSSHCLVMSANHGMAVKLDESKLENSNVAQVLRATLQLVTPEERDALRVGGAAKAVFDRVRETFLPAADLTKLAEYLARDASATIQLGTFVTKKGFFVSVSDLGLHVADALGTLSTKDQTFLVWGWQSLHDLPRDLHEWVDPRDGRMNLVQVKVTSARQSVWAPAAARPVTASQVKSARSSLGLKSSQTLCLPGQVRVPVTNQVLVSLVDHSSYGTTDCNSTSNGTTILSHMIGGGITARQDDERRNVPRGYTVLPPIQPGSPTVNDQRAIAAAGEAVLPLHQFLQPCSPGSTHVRASTTKLAHHKHE